MLSVLLRECNVFARKYFYPLISAASCYSALPSAAESHLPVAERISRQVLCLPIYGSLEPQTVRRIAEIIAEAQELATRERLARAKFEPRPGASKRRPKMHLEWS